MNAKRNAVSLLVVLVIIVIATMAYFYYQKQPDTSQQAIEMRTAADSMMKNDADTAFRLLRESIANESYPSLQRGVTTAFIADVFMIKSSRSVAFANRYVFTDDFAGFQDNAITDEDRRVADGIRRVYAHSLEFASSLPVSSYRLAEWHINRALEGENHELNITAMKGYLQKGDEALARVGETARVPEQIAYAYWLKGVVLDHMSMLIKDSGLPVRAEESFKKALDILARSNVLPMEGEVQFIWTRLNYAIFLDRNFGDARKDEIQLLLADIMSSPNRSQFGFTRYLDRLGELEPTFFDLKREKEAITSLAKYNAEFAAMLTKLGWEF